MDGVIKTTFLSVPQDPLEGTKHLSDSSTLVLTGVERPHAGVYQCTADNGVRDPVQADIHLTVLCKCRP